MPDVITGETRLTVVKLLAGGRDAEFVAAATHLKRDQVVDIAVHHGHPDPAKLAWAAEVLQRNLDRERAGAPTLRQTPPATSSRPAPARAVRLPAPAHQPPALAAASARTPVAAARQAQAAAPRPAAPRVEAAIVPVATIDAHPSNVGRNLGDLRGLVDSIARTGVLVPVILERRGRRYRLRDGHRRLAAAKLAKAGRIPAVIHAEQLDEREWLLEAVEYNVRRRGYSDGEQRAVAARLLELGVSKNAIAEAFGVSWSKLTRSLTEQQPKPRRASPRARATTRLVEVHSAEFAALLAEEQQGDAAEAQEGVS